MSLPSSLFCAVPRKRTTHSETTTLNHWPVRTPPTAPTVHPTSIANVSDITTYFSGGDAPTQSPSKSAAVSPAAKAAALCPSERLPTPRARKSKICDRLDPIAGGIEQPNANHRFN